MSVHEQRWRLAACVSDTDDESLSAGLELGVESERPSASLPMLMLHAREPYPDDPEPYECEKQPDQASQATQAAWTGIHSIVNDHRCCCCSCRTARRTRPLG